MTKEQFYCVLKENGLELSSIQKEQFSKYLSLLQETNKVMNLTAITEEEDVYEKHFYDCLLASFNIDFNDKKLVDVGTGAGFPGLVYAISYPSLQVTLVEPLTKRCNFLSKVKEVLNLTNVTIVNERSEDYVSKARENFDYATARAVARLNILLEIITPLLNTKGTFIALKGKQGEEEVKEANKALEILNCNKPIIKKTNLYSLDDERTNIYITLKGKVPLKYPRPYAQIKKKPL